MKSIGGGLAAQGLQQETEASGLLDKAANEESSRNMMNKQNAQANKAGNTQLGATAGAMAGMYFGPVGAMVGGLLGAIGGALSSN
jgi:hypothetical protein